MKKWLVFLYAFIAIFLLSSVVMYTLSSISLAFNKKAETEKLQQENQDKQDIELKANETIRVKMTGTGEVIAMDINDYLRGVVPAEMPPSYNMEALKAQAVVARTYTYNRIQNVPASQDFDITDSYTDSQAFYMKDKLFEIWRGRGFSQETIDDYWNRVCQAVSETQGMVATYKGEYIKAYFHASSPEKTESVDQIWGGIKYDYLVSVENKEDPNYTWNKSTIEISFSDFQKKVDENIDSGYSVNNRSTDDVIKIDSYTTSGRVKNVNIGNNTVSAEKLRTIFGLRSTNFTLKIENQKITFNVVGNGHGVGMSQVGADYYASQGMTYSDIIKHYYTGVDVVKVN